jgi:hypothetical protein
LFTLFESGEVVVTLAVFEIVLPAAALLDTVPTSVKVVVALAASVAMLQETVPFDPTGGVLQVNSGPD